MSFIIKTAKTVQEAIESGLLELGLDRKDVEIEVIEEPKSGFLGFGQKDAMVKLKEKEDISSFVRDILYDKKEEPKEEPKVEPKKEQPKKEKQIETKPVSTKEEPKEKQIKEEQLITKPQGEELVEKFETKKEETFKESQKIIEEKTLEKPKVQETEVSEESDLTEESETTYKNKSIEEIWTDIEIKNKSEEFLTTIIDEFGIDFNLLTELKDNELLVEIKSENPSNLGIVIGKHGSTLDSLQYLLSQVINKHKEDFVRVTVDANEYRDKRKRNLEKMAKRSVERLYKFNKPVKLEPMNAADRRIVHMALQHYEDITTHSEGRDPFRRVVITKEKKY